MVVIRAEVGLNGGMKTNSVVKIDPEIMGGTPCFAGTRVPARTLIDYLEGGDPLDDFLEDFPTVRREQAMPFASNLYRTRRLQENQRRAKFKP